MDYKYKSPDSNLIDEVPRTNETTIFERFKISYFWTQVVSGLLFIVAILGVILDETKEIKLDSYIIGFVLILLSVFSGLIASFVPSQKKVIYVGISLFVFFAIYFSDYFDPFAESVYRLLS